MACPTGVQLAKHTCNKILHSEIPVAKCAHTLRSTLYSQIVYTAPVVAEKMSVTIFKIIITFQTCNVSCDKIP